jgi:hypothetical protein
VTFKFYIDENLMPDIAPSLIHVYKGHHFRCPRQEQLLGFDDLDLFPELAIRDYDCIITEDKEQLANDKERDALRDSGLNWVGFKKLPVGGVAQLASQVAIVTSGLGLVLGAWSESAPTVYRLRGPRSYDEWKPIIEPV